MSGTEKEARTKWCPEARVAVEYGMAANWSGTMDPNGSGHRNIYPETRCKASDCMMWRWHDHPEGHHLFGYCGKAGKP